MKKILTLISYLCRSRRSSPLSKVPQSLESMQFRRGERVPAINRQLCHYAYHVGQIVMLAKQRRQGDWISLSVPREKSAEFNQRVLSKELSQR